MSAKTMLAAVTLSVVTLIMAALLISVRQPVVTAHDPAPDFVANSPSMDAASEQVSIDRTSLEPKQLESIPMLRPELTAQIGRSGRNWYGIDQETIVDRKGVPSWDFDRRFRSDAFRFVRVRFSSYQTRGPNGQWFTDYPDSDLNFSFRLKQLTTMDVDPEPLWLDITDPRLFEYPFLYMIEPGFIVLSDEEVLALQEYFRRGGFMMVDDFWGEFEWRNFHAEMSRVFPDQEPTVLTIDHPIFHIVYDLPLIPQVPSIHHWLRFGTTWEREDAVGADFRAYFDDNGRMVMIICHNTDLGDGWEREGESREYFETFSERLAYPMGINIVVYAMTH